MNPPRFLLWFIPNPKRFHRRRSDWLRLGLVLVLLLGTVAGIWGGPWLSRRLSCNDGFPTGDIWRAGNQCVGLSSGPYAFDLDAFAPVMRVIDRQNQAAADKCDPSGTPVTVGVLMTMTDRFVGGRAVQELEGMAAGQLRANGTGCLHPLRLVVGQLGEYGENGDPIGVARRLAERDEVVAVAGIGLSQQSSAEVADILAGAKIPMVADLITAEGFDQSGSREDQPIYSSCDPDITYPRGIGKDYYYRVAFRSSVQIARLGAAVPGRPDFIMVPTGGSDPYTCTALPVMQRQFGGNVTEVKFDSEEASTVPQTARRVCGAPKDVTVAYIARGRDLGRLIYSLDEAFANGQCAASSVTVVSTSDGQRLRAAELDPVLEDLRVRALRSTSFTTGKVRLVSALVGGADRATPDNPNFAVFEQAFTEAGFDLSHADAGWAVNAYDALITVSSALRALPASKEVHRSQVNTAISGFSSAGQSVPGAGGLITFDNSGNRVDVPPVVRVCPLPPASGDRPARVTSVPVGPDVAASCPS
ncbi:ABC transporter substrate-binding protein [Amycolatopsis nigrescens]|uniref:ABC transporter substrate-binding protein n=1 Tax=Amycolatopsis nigrescens TaxID=381445 RepID=UPI000362A470|nr:ABC transporter substrate-binding protein [Amycolatopsis nigrescens]